MCFYCCLSSPCYCNRVPRNCDHSKRKVFLTIEPFNEIVYSETYSFLCNDGVNTQPTTSYMNTRRPRISYLPCTIGVGLDSAYGHCEGTAVKLELTVDISIPLFYMYLFPRPPLWSSFQSSWLQIQRFGFDSRRYQIFSEK
jgi:hypothetical protein